MGRLDFFLFVCVFFFFLLSASCFFSPLVSRDHRMQQELRDEVAAAAGTVSNKNNYCLNAAEIGCLVPMRVNKLFYGNLVLKVAAKVLPAPVAEEGQ